MKRKSLREGETRCGLPANWGGLQHKCKEIRARITSEDLRSEKRGEEQNREEGEMAQKKVGGGRNRGKK